MSDLIERLTIMWRAAEYDHKTVNDAIDEIEKLERENEYLKECVDGWSRHSETLACQRDEMARVIADCDGMSCRQYRAIGK